MPEMGGYFLEHANFIPADPMKTPEHIAPVWYFTPFYSILRAIPDKFAGVIAMGGSIVVLFLLPWLDRCPVKSIRYRGGIFKKALLLFVVSFVVLGYLGTQPVTPVATTLARLFTAIYFGFFLLMPIYTRWEKTKPVPRSLTKEHSLEEQLHTIEEQLPALIEEITALKPVTAEIGHPAFKSSFFNRRPNPEGMVNVISRLARKLKGSLD
jgi:ubiquinol-cytochrome c reductase cytochrome b subunit